MRLFDIQPGELYAIGYETILRSCIMLLKSNPELINHYGLDRETLIDRSERGEISGLACIMAMTLAPGELLARMIAGRDARSFKPFPVRVTSVREPYLRRRDGIRAVIQMSTEPLELLMHYSSLQCSWDDWLLQTERERMRAEARRLARLNAEFGKLVKGESQ